MRTVKTLALAGLLAAVMAGTSAMAQTTAATNANGAATPPVVVEKGKVPIPADLQALVKKFEAERGVYLTQQKELLARLKNAATPEQRAAIRAALQDNREDFLADLKDFRQDLKTEITELKDKLNNAELDRLIEEVKQGTTATHHHHGKT
jgi:hypothetical protein